MRDHNLMLLLVGLLIVLGMAGMVWFSQPEGVVSEPPPPAPADAEVPAVVTPAEVPADLAIAVNEGDDAPEVRELEAIAREFEALPLELVGLAYMHPPREAESRAVITYADVSMELDCVSYPSPPDAPDLVLHSVARGGTGVVWQFKGERFVMKLASGVQPR